MEPIIYVFAFALGAIVGSFLNVVVARWKTGMTLGGRSMCFSCGVTLGPIELVPIASFFIQGGRCRRCKSSIAWQYPAVEAATGLVFLALVSLGLTAPVTLFYAAIFSILVVISVYDLRHTIIPDELVYLFALVSLARIFFLPALPGASFAGVTLLDLIAGPLLAAPFAALWGFSRGRWMGLGDAKLALGIGWLLGADSGFAAIMFAFWIGAFGGIAVLLWGNKHFKMGSEIPFGPFLALAAFLVFFLGISFSSLQLFVGSLFL